ncbi:Aspartyl-tRNA(Asn) amidotransferase subunit A [Mycoplasmopsis meleagridis]|uniref:Aspartyl-tRNA(Asn) amidotransferase subunit A, Glutamyl-tRNA(Gln) amidotransferase subunit A n=1 Tax=Mycoplasmopsis meleagridis ATCC 25294 TaxID=1264554 RepID=A0A0F5H1D7_9BACT|nr:amidase family protein [Mycoplasmopsis meleagridis]KKB26672.1 Aspartyl-tRNA(Asn) amidotransferase subunit A, Glutamyl-tRNA(Gln) amidotransferase subunit A [Mycoplasmopsis meleagridis ATCC 25294]OAD18213.1 Aspartyl-tRNA(Asn) amidotransferase subunit A [Mycoplasmopsis meleagridis]VEU77727.1 aspartyl/glutamyl-tRNA(Asn/Gln) amidotransferase subunit A [Mycoplasmopsis meleagridis]
MELIEKGNWDKASLELKNDQNNAVVDILDKFQYKQKTNNLLKDAVFTIKDNFATSFSKSTASSNFLKNFFPSYNATAIEKLLIAGALPIAKVNCDELALGGTGTFSANGLIKNPLDETRLAGGSSSGSVATLTKNISFALASDTGDSVRLPASYNGKVGFKPSYGAISRYGLFAYASSLDTVAYFAHNVNDISIISQVLYGKDDKDFTSIDVKIDNIAIKKPKKIAFLNTKKINEKLYKNFISLYKNLNNDKEIKIDLIEPNTTILKAIKPTYDVISYSEASSNLSNLNGIAFGERINGNNWNETMTNSRSKGFGYMVQRRLTLGSFFLYSENQAEIFIKAQKARRVIKNYLDDLHSKYDIVIFPASADVAPLIKGENKNYDYMEYILTGDNLVGNPSITIPFMRINNLPINLAISSKIYSDENLLSFALWIEKYLKDTKYE